jgi:putative membrane protein
MRTKTVSAMATLAGGLALLAAAIPRPPMTDANILAKLQAADTTEIASAGYVGSNTQSPAVRQFAGMLITDHQQSLAEDRALAQRTGITPEPASDDTTMQHGQNELARLRSLSRGAAMDTAFVNAQVMDHQANIAAAQAALAQAQNADVKAKLQKTIPVLTRHLHLAQDLQKSGSR